MLQIIEKLLPVVGYDHPYEVGRRTVWMCTTFALASCVGKVFHSKVEWKSHLVFGQAVAITFSLLYFNKHFRLTRDPQKNEVLYRVYFLMLSTLPLAMGRMVTNRCFGKISWVQSGKRGIYLLGVGLATLYVVGSYERGKRK